MTVPGYWLFWTCSPSAPVSGTGTGFDSSPIKGEGDMVGLDYSPSPHPVVSRLRGNDGEGFISGYLGGDVSYI